MTPPVPQTWSQRNQARAGILSLAKPTTSPTLPRLCLFVNCKINTTLCPPTGKSHLPTRVTSSGQGVAPGRRLPSAGHECFLAGTRVPGELQYQTWAPSLGLGFRLSERICSANAGFDPWVREHLLEKECHKLTPVFLPADPTDRGAWLAATVQRGFEELDTTMTEHEAAQFSLLSVGEEEGGVTRSQDLLHLKSGGRASSARRTGSFHKEMCLFPLYS